jgi:transposase
MKTIYVRPLREEEREEVRKGLKSTLSFTLRRCQIVLWSADERLTIGEIAKRLQLSHEAVRRVVHAFEQTGISCIHPKSRARHDKQRAFDETGRSALREALNHAPREFGYERSFWTLELLAAYSYQKGWTKQKVHLDTISQTLRELGVKWRRSKTWISSPDEAYEVKKAP